MDTLQLDEKIKSPSFLGAHPYDSIPSKPVGVHSLIINTGPSSEPGDHWLALIYKDETFYFLDSYGRSVNDFTFSTDFRHTIKKYIGTAKSVHNNKWVQSLTSNVCGDYCVYFIEEMHRVGFEKMMGVFTDRFTDNDMLVLNYVQNI